jgi:hypothetical protein
MRITLGDSRLATATLSRPSMAVNVVSPNACNITTPLPGDKDEFAVGLADSMVTRSDSRSVERPQA